MVFGDRADAGRCLAARLQHLRGGQMVVLGPSPGAVPVAAEVARALNAPPAGAEVRELGVPLQPQLSTGVIGEDGVRSINDEVIRLADVSERWTTSAAANERAEPECRARRLRGDRPCVSLVGRTTVVDS
ncbi:MAG TPA: hypothetical protein VMU75_13215 [Acidimicrobiales bacterium]|nr:hypothetical protein [Acidimicrobiales bacterium]